MKKNMKKIGEIDRKHVNILGIDINSTSTLEVLASVETMITHNVKFYIATPNPEHVLASTTNADLKKAINGAAISIPDGFGLKCASLFLYGRNLNVIHGRKLFMDLVNLADSKEWRIFLLSGLDKEAKIVSSKLRLRHKKVKVETSVGPVLTGSAVPVSEADKRIERESIDKINKFRPHLLFVAFGNPKQEIWIYKNINKLNIGGAMVVGGTFRYIAGLSPLPPKWMEKLELEWLFRLITEPYRFKRIIKAVILFPLRVFWFKVTGN